MSFNNFFSHTGSNGSSVGDRVTAEGYNWTNVGENIASGQTTPEAALESWLNSPGHCANIMNPDFTELGAGIESPNGTLWTQVFASTGNNPNPNPNPNPEPNPNPQPNPEPNPQPNPQPNPNPNPADFANQILNLVNQARAAGQVCGTEALPAVPALTLNAQLNQAAQRHSDDMATNNIFSHTGSDGSSFGQRIADTGYQSEPV